MRRKQIVIIIVTLALAVSMLGKCPAPVVKEAFAAEEISKEAIEQRFVPEEKYWKYETNPYIDGVVSITGVDDSEIYNLEDWEKDGITYCLVVPTEIAGKRVTGIDLGNSFYTDRKVTSFELPSTLQYISSTAFMEMEELVHIVIPASVTDIQCEWDINFSKITIKCPDGSVAEDFAKKNGANIVLIPTADSTTQEPSVTASPAPTASTATREPDETVSPVPTDKPNVDSTSVEGGTSTAQPSPAPTNIPPSATPTPTPTSEEGSDASPKPTATSPQGTGTVSQAPQATKRPSSSSYYPTYSGNTTTVKAPGKVKLKKVKALGKQKVKVVWKWSVSQNGYQLQYAMNRSFTKNRKTQNKSFIADTATIKKLKKGKTYYFRVRAYNMALSGAKKYGKWSNVKKCKVK